MFVLLHGEGEKVALLPSNGLKEWKEVLNSSSSSFFKKIHFKNCTALLWGPFTSSFFSFCLENMPFTVIKE